MYVGISFVAGFSKKVEPISFWFRQNKAKYLKLFKIFVDPADGGFFFHFNRSN